MTTKHVLALSLLDGLLVAALSIASSACGDDSNADTATAGTSSPAAGTAARGGSGPGGAGAGKVSSDPNAAATCPDKVYEALSDECGACACGVDPALAPSCQKPCWDFLACSFAAQAGKCASFAAGGAEMRPQFEACTMEECGAELAVPGAEVVSSYRSIVGACAVSMGGAKAACGDDITKFTAELKP
jgi:hypothetical protein